MTDVQAGAAPAYTPAKTFTSAEFHRKQRRHFLLFDVLPALGTLFALFYAFRAPPGPLDLALFFALWLVTGLGLTVGFHRYFSHRAFATKRWIAYGLLAAGSMAARGPMMSWVIMHRRHHECSDRDGDLHSPHAPQGGWRGLLHAHFTWMVAHDYPNVVHYAPDLLRDKAVQRWNRQYDLWVIAGLLVPALIGGLATGRVAGAFSAFLWGGVVRLFVVEQTMSCINSICHAIGAQPHRRRDESRNIAWLGLASWGESHHNNHHDAPYAAAFGRTGWELDPGYWFILALERLGLAWDVRRPARLAASPQSAQGNG